jgi:hypothetical protein
LQPSELKNGTAFSSEYTFKEKQLLVRVGESGKKRMRLVSRIPFERMRECSQKQIHDITEVMEHERDEE